MDRPLTNESLTHTSVERVSYHLRYISLDIVLYILIQTPFPPSNSSFFLRYKYHIAALHCLQPFHLFTSDAIQEDDLSSNNYPVHKCNRCFILTIVTVTTTVIPASHILLIHMS